MKPASDLMAWKVSARSPTELVAEEQGSVGRVVFVRYSRRYGIVLLVSYLNEQQTKCDCVIGGTQYIRWYETAIITTRQAALLVNRFFDDIGAAMTQPAGSATNDKPPVLEFRDSLSEAEQQRLRELASQLDAAIGTKPGKALGALIATVNKNRKVRP